jgi:hypothetical protein
MNQRHDNLLSMGLITFDPEKNRRNIPTWDLVSNVSSQRFFHVKTVFSSEQRFELQNILKFRNEENLLLTSSSFITLHACLVNVFSKEEVCMCGCMRGRACAHFLCEVSWTRSFVRICCLNTD